MKSTILINLMLACVFAIVSACSSDDNSESNYTEESYLATTGFDESETIYTDMTNIERGLDFTPLVEGEIRALRVMLPEANPELRITIWNKENGTVLRTEIVNVATANTEFTFDISDLVLTKDNEYAITMNGNDWIHSEKADGTDIVYPVIVVNIQINAYKWLLGIAQTYPTNSEEHFYTGDLSFDFIQTE